MWRDCSKHPEFNSETKLFPSWSFQSISNLNRPHPIRKDKKSLFKFGHLVTIGGSEINSMSQGHESKQGWFVACTVNAVRKPDIVKGLEVDYRECPGRLQYRRPIETELIPQRQPTEPSYKHCMGVRSLLSGSFYSDMVIRRLTNVGSVRGHRLCSLKYAGQSLSL